MRREQLFNRDGVYSALVTGNHLMHREATATGIEILSILAQKRKLRRPIRVLDLACGGLPIAIADMMEHIADASFSYTGIDINPDQVKLAGKFFQVSDNVLKIDIIEGNAWDLSDLNLPAPFDLIFTGFNLHHGTPEEIDYLMAQVRELLDDKGIFLNHDWYRPDHETYVRRPCCNPQDPDESYRLVPAQSLNACIRPYAKKSVLCSSESPEWRLAFINGLTDAYWQHQKDDQGARTLKSHMLDRDFPVSRTDLAEILERHGFNYDFIHHNAPGVAIGPFLAMPFACKDEGVYHRIYQATGLDTPYAQNAVA